MSITIPYIFWGVSLDSISSLVSWTEHPSVDREHLFV